MREFAKKINSKVFKIYLSFEFYFQRLKVVYEFKKKISLNFDSIEREKILFYYTSRIHKIKSTF